MSKENSFFIDCVRVLASQLVLFGHSFSFFNVTLLKDQTYFAYIQNIGVVLLFAISGFLFSYTLKKRGGGRTFKDYYINRLIRIKIPYAGAMLFVCIISLITIAMNSDAFQYYDAFNVKTFVMNVFMLQEYPVFILLDKVMGTGIAITSFSSARPFWTLAVEWWYYMFFGYLWLHLKNKNQIRLADILVLGILSVVPVANLLHDRGLTLVWIGGIVIENVYRSIDIKSKILLKVILISLIFLLIADGIFVREAYSKSFQALTLLVLLVFFVILKDDNNGRAGKKLRGTVKILASYSYSLYLLHYTILDYICCIPNSNISGWLKMFTGVVLSNVLAYGFAYFFERKTSWLVKKCSERVDFRNK